MNVRFLKKCAKWFHASLICFGALTSCVVQESHAADVQQIEPNQKTNLDKEFFTHFKLSKTPSNCKTKADEKGLACAFGGLEQSCDVIDVVYLPKLLMPDGHTLLKCDKTVKKRIVGKSAVKFAQDWGWGYRGYYGNYIQVTQNTATLIDSVQKLQRVLAPIDSPEKAVALLLLMGEPVRTSVSRIQKLDNAKFLIPISILSDPYVKPVAGTYRIMYYSGYSSLCTNKIEQTMSIINLDGQIQNAQKVIWKHPKPPACIH